MRRIPQDHMLQGYRPNKSIPLKDFARQLGLCREHAERVQLFTGLPVKFNRTHLERIARLLYIDVATALYKFVRALKPFLNDRELELRSVLHDKTVDSWQFTCEGVYNNDSLSRTAYGEMRDQRYYHPGVWPWEMEATLRGYYVRHQMRVIALYYDFFKAIGLKGKYGA